MRSILHIALLWAVIALVAGLTTTTIVPKAIAQNENKSEKMEMVNMSNTSASLGKIPSMSTPGEKTFYIFTSEVQNVDENKLKVAGDSFSVNTLVVNKGDKVTVNFYNVDDVKTERHSFTIGDPYKVNIDLGFAQNGNATFTADQSGIFPYYCKYHLPVMTGQLLVLP
ncbi:MAG TPA: cupredoxin domain-containing protein [Nitrososphaeraceae archaeon]